MRLASNISLSCRYIFFNIYNNHICHIFDNLKGLFGTQKGFFCEPNYTAMAFLDNVQFCNVEIF